MQKFILIASTLLLLTSTLSAQESYEKAMANTLETLQVEHPDWAKVAAEMKKISAENETEWLPLYYHAFAKMNLAFGAEMTEKDNLLDQAQASLDAALGLNDENSELHALQGQVYLVRIAVSPFDRGPEFSMLANAALKKAKSYDAENPRIYFLYGMNILYTPEQFGGGPQRALKYFKLAKEKYDTFVPVSNLHPTWGESENQEKLESIAPLNDK